jgi:hypothetical protein
MNNIEQDLAELEKQFGSDSGIEELEKEFQNTEQQYADLESLTWSPSKLDPLEPEEGNAEVSADTYITRTFANEESAEGQIVSMYMNGMVDLDHIPDEVALKASEWAANKAEEIDDIDVSYPVRAEYMLTGTGTATSDKRRNPMSEITKANLKAAFSEVSKRLKADPKYVAASDEWHDIFAREAMESWDQYDKYREDPDNNEFPQLHKDGVGQSPVLQPVYREFMGGIPLSLVQLGLEGYGDADPVVRGSEEAKTMSLRDKRDRAKYGAIVPMWQFMGGYKRPPMHDGGDWAETLGEVGGSLLQFISLGPVKMPGAAAWEGGQLGMRKIMSSIGSKTPSTIRMKTPFVKPTLADRAKNTAAGAVGFELAYQETGISGMDRVDESWWVDKLQKEAEAMAVNVPAMVALGEGVYQGGKLVRPLLYKKQNQKINEPFDTPEAFADTYNKTAKKVSDGVATADEVRFMQMVKIAAEKKGVSIDTIATGEKGFKLEIKEPRKFIQAFPAIRQMLEPFAFKFSKAKPPKKPKVETEAEGVVVKDAKPTDMEKLATSTGKTIEKINNPPKLPPKPIDKVDKGLNFVSGLERSPADASAAIAGGASIGIRINEPLSQPLIDKVVDLTKLEQNVFIEHGLYKAADGQAAYDNNYVELADRLEDLVKRGADPTRLYVMLPDALDNHQLTRDYFDVAERTFMGRDALKDVNYIFVMQRDMPGGTLEKSFPPNRSEGLTKNITLGIPANLSRVNVQELQRLFDKGDIKIFERFHLLGVDPASERGKELISVIRKNKPEAIVSADTALGRSSVNAVKTENMKSAAETLGLVEGVEEGDWTDLVSELYESKPYNELMPWKESEIEKVAKVLSYNESEYKEILDLFKQNKSINEIEETLGYELGVDTSGAVDRETMVELASIIFPKTSRYEFIKEKAEKASQPKVPPTEPEPEGRDEHILHPDAKLIKDFSSIQQVHDKITALTEREKNHLLKQFAESEGEDLEVLEDQLFLYHSQEPVEYAQKVDNGYIVAYYEPLSFDEIQDGVETPIGDLAQMEFYQEARKRIEAAEREKKLKEEEERSFVRVESKDGKKTYTFSYNIIQNPEEEYFIKNRSTNIGWLSVETKEGVGWGAIIQTSKYSLIKHRPHYSQLDPELSIEDAKKKAIEYIVNALEGYLGGRYPDKVSPALKKAWTKFIEDNSQPPLEEPEEIEDEVLLREANETYRRLWDGKMGKPTQNPYVKYFKEVPPIALVNLHDRRLGELRGENKVEWTAIESDDWELLKAEDYGLEEYTKGYILTDKRESSIKNDPMFKELDKLKKKIEKKIRTGNKATIDVTDAETLKQQRAYITEKLNSITVKNDPFVDPTDPDIKELSRLQAEYERTPKGDGTTDYTKRSRLAVEIGRLAQKLMEDGRLPYIELAVPYDGTFRIINSKQSIEKFKKKIGKNAVNFGKVKKPSERSIKPQKRTALTVKSKTLPKDFLDAAKPFAQKKTKLESRRVQLETPVQSALLDNTIIATDGKRIIFIASDKKLDNFVQIADDKTIQSGEAKDQKYPNFHQVIPEGIMGSSGYDLFNFNPKYVEHQPRNSVSPDQLMLWATSSTMGNPDSGGDHYLGFHEGTDGFIAVRTRAKHENGDVAYQSGNAKDTPADVTVNANHLKDIAKAASKLGAKIIEIRINEDNPEISPVVFLFRDRPDGEIKGWVLQMPIRPDAGVREEPKVGTGIFPWEYAMWARSYVRMEQFYRKMYIFNKGQGVRLHPNIEKAHLRHRDELADSVEHELLSKEDRQFLASAFIRNHLTQFNLQEVTEREKALFRDMFPELVTAYNNLRQKNLDAELRSLNELRKIQAEAEQNDDILTGGIIKDITKKEGQGGRKLIGTKIPNAIDGNIEDFIRAAQVLRSPDVEYTHFVAVKNGEVVEVITDTVRSPNQAPIDYSLPKYLDKDVDAFYLVHNHPTGDPTASPADYGVHSELKKNDKYAGSIVLDHGEYSFARHFDTEFKYGVIKDIALQTDFLAVSSGYNPLAGIAMNTTTAPYYMEEFMKQFNGLAEEQEAASYMVFHFDNQNMSRGVQRVLLNQTTDFNKLSFQIRQTAQKLGATQTIIFEPTALSQQEAMIQKNVWSKVTENLSGITAMFVRQGSEFGVDKEQLQTLNQVNAQDAEGTRWRHSQGEPSPEEKTRQNAELTIEQDRAIFKTDFTPIVEGEPMLYADLVKAIGNAVAEEMYERAAALQFYKDKADKKVEAYIGKRINEEGFEDHFIYDSYAKKWVARFDRVEMPHGGFGYENPINMGKTSEPTYSSFEYVDQDGNVIKQEINIEAIPPIRPPEIIKLYKALKGEVPRIQTIKRKRKGGKTLGYVRPAKKGGDWHMVINQDIFTLPLDNALKTLMHEFGHVIDYLMDETFQRGNIIARLASKKNSTAKTLPAFMGAPLIDFTMDKSERDRIRRDAKKQIRHKYKQEWIEIAKKNGLTPEDTFMIPNRETEWELKWGQFNEKKDSSKTAGQFVTALDKKIAEEARKLSVQMVAQRMTEQGLLDNATVHAELIELMDWWKPIPKSAPKSYKAYRQSSEELYADALSVLFIAPHELKDRAPLFWQGFFAYLKEKPLIERKLRKVWESIRTQGAVGLRKKRIELRRKSWKSLEQQIIEEDKFGRNPKTAAEKWAMAKENYYDYASGIVDRARKAKKLGAKFNWWDDPENLWGVHPFSNNEPYLWIDSVQKKIIDPLTRQGLSIEDLGVFLMNTRIIYEANERNTGRSQIANPDGLSPSEAKAELRGLRDVLGGEKMNILEGYAKTFREMFFEIYRELYKYEVFTEEAFTKQILPNKDNYATFAIAEYFLDKPWIPAGLRMSFGTFKEAINPFTAMTIKAVEALKVLQKQKAHLATVKMMLKYFPEEIQEVEHRMVFDTKKMYRKKEYKESQITRLTDDPNKEFGIIQLPMKGKRTAWVVPYGVGVAHRGASPDRDALAVQLVNNVFRKVFYPMYITYNPGFQWILSPWRDFNRTYVNTPNAISRARLLRAYKKMWRESWGRIKGEASPLIKEMMMSGAIGTPFDNYAQNLHKDPEGIFELLMERYRLKPSRSKNEIVKKLEKALSPLAWMGGKILQIGQTFETLAKVAPYYVLTRELGVKPEEAGEFVRNHTGVPPYWKRGRKANIMQAIMPFVNVAIKGYMEDAKLALGQREGLQMHDRKRFAGLGFLTSGSGGGGGKKPPRNPSLDDPMPEKGGRPLGNWSPRPDGGKVAYEWWYKYMRSSGMMVFLRAAATAGLFGEAVRRIMEMIPNHDQDNYHCIPLGYVYVGKDGSDQYASITSEEIPRGAKALYFRLPIDESQKMLSTTLYRVFMEMLQVKNPDVNRLQGEGMEDLPEFLGDQIPGLNPSYEISKAWFDYAKGGNPTDTFTGRPILSYHENLARGTDGFKAMLLWTYNEAGFGNFIGIDPETDTVTEYGLKTYGKQTIGRLIKISDGGKYEKGYQADESEDIRYAKLFLTYDEHTHKMHKEHSRVRNVREENRDLLVTPEEYWELKGWYKTYQAYHDQAKYYQDQIDSPEVSISDKNIYKRDLAEIRKDLEAHSRAYTEDNTK